MPKTHILNSFDFFLRELALYIRNTLTFSWIYFYSFRNVNCGEKKGCVFVDNPVNNSLEDENNEIDLIKRIFNLTSENISIERLGDRINVHVSWSSFSAQVFGIYFTIFTFLKLFYIKELCQTNTIMNSLVSWRNDKKYICFINLEFMETMFFLCCCHNLEVVTFFRENFFLNVILSSFLMVRNDTTRS